MLFMIMTIMIIHSAILFSFISAQKIYMYIYDDNFEFYFNFNERALFRMWMRAIKDRHTVPLA
jgi:hypothetical protein